MDNLTIALGKTDLREIKYLDQLKIKDQMIEESKPKWWQHPLVITGEVIIAFITGVFIAK